MTVGAARRRPSPPGRVEDNRFAGRRAKSSDLPAGWPPRPRTGPQATRVGAGGAMTP
jgi:hypothetical protein